MMRHRSKERPEWRRRVEADGLVFHTGTTPYWCETAHYEFRSDEIDMIETATGELQAMCLQAVEHVVARDRFSELKIGRDAAALVRESWRAKRSSLYGRFDLSYGNGNPPKLLEYNADTPTSLLEASVIQWRWLEDMFPHADQFNSIHESLVARWTELRPTLPPHVHFASVDDVEDVMTVAYLQDTAQQAGIDGTSLFVGDIGWDGAQFVDTEGTEIHALFKLYPWEWLVAETFGTHIARNHLQWLEPAWKMVLSNKGILAILWELFPESPYLLETHLEPTQEMQTWGFVKKPLLSREGANVTISAGLFGTDERSGGAYGDEGFVYQAVAKLPDFNGRHPVIGSWVVGDQAVGMGIRESQSLITDNRSQFVPHVIR
jgi:glutathionylspermidine synthase